MARSLVICLCSAALAGAPATPNPSSTAACTTTTPRARTNTTAPYVYGPVYDYYPAPYFYGGYYRRYHDRPDPRRSSLRRRRRADSRARPVGPGPADDASGRVRDRTEPARDDKPAARPGGDRYGGNRGGRGGRR